MTIGVKPQNNFATSFETRAREVHGDKYDYSKVKYINARTKVEIVCPVHGSFLQVPDSHLNGRGCRKCSFINSKPTSFSVRSTSESFIEKAKAVHGEEYDYSKVDYQTSKTKVEIICRTHGSFHITPNNHLTGVGCPKCGIEKAHHAGLRYTTEDFIALSIKTWGNRFDYSKSVYKDKESPITITCKEHGDFEISTAQRHYVGNAGCPVCASSTSKGQELIAEFIRELGFSVELNNKTLLQNNQHLDIVVEDKKLAIEFNGNYWHSTAFRTDPNYHANKTKIASEKGYRLIHIFEHEWEKNQEVIKSRLSHILGVSSKKLYARNLEITEISSADAFEFFQKNHVQGGMYSKYNLALLDGSEVVAVMSFQELRFEESKEQSLELIRFASKYSIVGGFSKLLKGFIRSNPSITEIISYSDRCWSVGDVYVKNGFEYAGTSKPGYFYTTPNLKTMSRQSCMKHKLKDKLPNFDESKTELENMEANGFFRVYDCGNDKWVLKLQPQQSS